MQFDLSVRADRAIEQLSGLYRDLVAVILISILLFVLIVLHQWLAFLAPIRLLLALAYVFYIPGYCLTAALFPGLDDLNPTERAGLSLGLSIAWVPILALLLDRLSWGLHIWPIYLGEIGSSLVFLSISVWRRVHLPRDQAYTPDFSWRPRAWWRSLLPDEKQIHKLLLGALLVAAISVAWVLLLPSPAEAMTEFYMLSQDGRAENFPREILVEQELQLTLGISNREWRQHSYRVEVWAEDIWSPGRRQLLAESGPVVLAAGEKREWQFSWRMPWVGQDQKVAFLLFRGESREPYRDLHLYLNVNP